MRTLHCCILCIAVLIVPISASACSCLRPTVKEGLKYADIAFRGELIEQRGALAVFRVDEIWKGHLKHHVSFQWRIGSHGDCDGFWPKLLKEGNNVLLFGIWDERGFYKADICLPQKLVSDADADLQELGQGKPPESK